MLNRFADFLRNSLSIISQLLLPCQAIFKTFFRRIFCRFGNHSAELFVFRLSSSQQLAYLITSDIIMSSVFEKFFEQFVRAELATMASLVFLFLLLFIMIKIFCHIIIRLSGVISKIPIIGKVDKILGALLGFLKGGIAVVLVFLVYSVYSGAYVDILWREAPQVMTIVETVRSYLQQLWSAF